MIAPSIKNPEVAQALARAAYSGVHISVVLDAREALDPDAYTRHLSTVPGLFIRLYPHVRRALLITEGLVLEGDGVWLPEGGVEAKREQGQAAWFSRIFINARPYVYVPQPPPGYRIVEKDPALEALENANEALERAFKDLYGGTQP